MEDFGAFWFRGGVSTAGASPDVLSGQGAEFAHFVKVVWFDFVERGVEAVDGPEGLQVEKLRASDNIFLRRAGHDIIGPDGKPAPPRWRFVGVGFPAGEDFALGARIAQDGSGPWQWGIPVLM